MAKTCNGCGSDTEVMAMIPFAAYEKEVVVLEGVIKRQWIAIILAILMLFCSFGLFVWYESRFDNISYSQDGEGINSVNFGEQGDLNNGTESSYSEEEEWQSEGA